MTMYTQTDSYLNEIDALSWKNRPICSTLRGSSSYNAYESQTEDETSSYSWFRNQAFIDESSCDSYIHHERSTISNACNYNVLRYNKNLIDTDNLMYHRDACSGDSKYEIYSSVNYGDCDNQSGEYTYYLNGEGANGLPFSSLSGSNNKILPQVPPLHLSQSICSRQHNNVSLISTPTLDNIETGNEWNEELWNYSMQSHHNVDATDGINGTKADRVLPIIHSKPICFTKSINQKFYETNACHTSMLAMRTSTSMAVLTNQNNTDNEMMPTETSTIQINPGHTLDVNDASKLNKMNADFNNCYCSNDRYIMGPHSAMFVQPTEICNDIGFSSVDNISTYSDNIGNTTTFLNHPKLQDLQKCKYSIIMAMTTASVIASGETRIPQHMTKKLEKPPTIISRGKTCSTSARKVTSSLEICSKSRCNNSLSDNTTNSLSEDNNLITSRAYTATITVKSNNIAATSMLLLSSASPIVADDLNTNNITAASCESKITDSVIERASMAIRKLPNHLHGVENSQTILSKQLPQTPQYSFIASTSTKILPTSISLVPRISTISSQPMSQTKTNESLCTLISITSIMSTTTSTIASSIPDVFSISLMGSTPTSVLRNSYLLEKNDNYINKCKRNCFNNNIENAHENYNTEVSQSQKSNQHTAGSEAVLTNTLSTTPSKLTETHPFTIAVSSVETISCAIVTSISTITHASTTTVASTLSSVSSFETTTLISIDNESLEATKTVPTVKLPFNTYIPVKPSIKTMTAESKSTLNTDYKKSFHIADYLKPYTLQTYISANGDDEDLHYIPYYNIDDIGNSLSSSMKSTPKNNSITFTSSTAKTAPLQKNGLDNKTEALIFSDNISSYSIRRRSSVRSKEPNTDSLKTTSCFPTTVSTSVSTIVTSLMPCETLSISTYLDSKLINLQTTTAENLKEKTKEMPHETDKSIFIGKNYFSGYKIDCDLTSKSAITSSPSMFASSNSSSLRLNKSLPITTMSLTKIKTYEAESTPSLLDQNCMVTTIPTANNEDTTKCTIVKFASYTDYVEENNMSQKLPSYITNLLPASHVDELDDQGYSKLNTINNEYGTLYSSLTPLSIQKNSCGKKEILNSLAEETTESSLAPKSDANESLIKQEQIFTTPYFTVCSTDLTTTNPLTTNTASTIVDDFDDNFYDSFNVNLYSLFTDTSTCTTTSYTATTRGGPEMSKFTFTPTTASFETKPSISLDDKIIKQVSFNVENKSRYLYNISAIGGSKGDTTSSTPYLTAIPHKTASYQASSLLVGLSQSLKMGLDGSAAGEGNGNIQQHPKKSFGFGLASKLVPNVGNLLAAATKSATTISQESNAITPCTSIHTSELPINQIQEAQKDNNLIRSPLSYCGYVINTTTSIATATFNEESNNNTNNITISDDEKCNFTISNLDNGVDDSGLYYSREPAFYHVTHSTAYFDQDLKCSTTDQVMIYDTIEDQGFADVFEYDEYCNSNDHESATPTINFVDQPKHIRNTNTTSTSSVTSNNNTSAERGTIELISSITHAGSHHSHLPPTVPTYSVTKSSNIKSSGLFGSILGKAAAVIQTANDVVNQSSSIASLKVQKNIQSTTTSLHCLNGVVHVESANLGLISNVDFCAVTETSNSVIRSNSLTQDDSQASSYSLSDDDYDTYHLDENEYYNLNKNSKQVHVMKILPKVPAGSTGKKLPNINDKSGYVIKNQSKDIHDKEEEVLGNKSLSSQNAKSIYDINSEQKDYYMDVQQAESVSSSHSITTNGYYDNKNRSYDYRDDYFNEEDEFKYIEKEQIKTKDERNVLYNQQQLLCQMHKQSSYLIEEDYQNLETEIRNEYMDDMYQSDDSDNYLDESSSISINHQQQQPQSTISTKNRDHQGNGVKTYTCTPTTSNSRTTKSFIPHQQIKKQVKIIIDDEKNELSSLDDLHDIMIATSKAVIFSVEDDRIGDSLPSFRTRKSNLIRGETEEVVSGHIQIMKRKSEVTAKQRWHWAYNKIIIQLNLKKLL